MESSTAQHAAADPAGESIPRPPNWAMQQEDLHCPLCGYNLRGLSEPRCPECGHRFDWAVVTDPSRRLHPYLFEHHPERNLRSFLRTLWGTLRPRRFWDSLPANQPLRPRRMVIYWLLAALVASTAVIGQWVRAIVTLWTEQSRGWMFSSPYSVSRAAPAPPELTWGRLGDLAVAAWQYDSRLDATLWAFVICSAWTWMTLLAFQVFRISMRRARIRPVHVARSVVYSFDAIIWPGLAAFVATATVIALALLLSKRDFSLLWQAVAIAPWVVIAVVEYRLVMAYRHYLRFDRPFLTILASQIVAGLVVLNVLVYLENLRH